MDKRADTGHVYLCIDLKSFYASVECVERGLDPLEARLVVADPRRTEKTICLAVSPALKALGVRNRCRVFEIPKNIDYITAMPHMRRYMEVSAQIYGVYLRYISPDDIHVYSIDECFIDATPYLKLYGMSARGLAVELMGAVLAETGITATAGIGPNLFLAKVALDVAAKHAPDRIGVLDEESFRRTIWPHRPITDIWNIGPGIARRLEAHGIHDLAGVALADPQMLYREFGVNAEYLIDHAWGIEPCTIAEIHAYRPSAKSMTNGQVLPCDYSYEEASDVLREMADASVLELVEKGLVTEQVGVTVGYAYVRDDTCPGGRSAWPHTGGSRKLPERTNSRKKLLAHVAELYEQTTARDRAIRRLGVSFGALMPEEFATAGLFDDAEALGRERDLQKAVLAIKGRFGKNALLMGTSLKDKATARERNEQIGGHNA